MQFNNREPIYLQVIDDIKRRLALGKLTPGEKLPSTRALSLEYGINANTAARIYKEMESQGLCFTKRGLGTFVSESEDIMTDIKKQMAQGYVKDFIEAMSLIGYNIDEMQKLIEKRRNDHGTHQNQ